MTLSDAVDLAELVRECAPASLLDLDPVARLVGRRKPPRWPRGADPGTTTPLEGWPLLASLCGRDEDTLRAAWAVLQHARLLECPPSGCWVRPFTKEEEG